MMKWFRLYNSVRTDPKIGQLRPQLFRFWIHCLCFASERKGVERGTLPTVNEIAFEFGMRVSDVDRFMRELVVAGLIHISPDTPDSQHLNNGLVNDSLTPCESVVNTMLISEHRLVTEWCASVRFVVHEWKTRQREGDTSARRVSAHRERRLHQTAAGQRKVNVTPAHHAEGVTCNGDETVDETPCASRTRAHQIQSIEKEKEKKESPPLSFGHRHPEDQADVDRAIGLLEADPRTATLAPMLRNSQGLPSSIGVPGWKWLKAAERQLHPKLSASKRGSWGYFAGTARQITDGERDEGQAQAQKPRPSGPALPPPVPPSKPKQPRKKPGAPAPSSLTASNGMPALPPDVEGVHT